MRRILFIAALFFFGSAVSAQNIERSFAARDGGSLELKLETGGDLFITGGAGSTVEVVVKREGRDADRVDVQFSESNGRIRIESRRQGRNINADVTYTISVPSRFDLNIDLSGGDVTVDGVTGSLSLETMGGDLELTGLGGSLKATTMGGDIELGSARVDGSVETMGGDITLKDVTGDVDAKTMGGDIEFDNVRPSGKRALRIETMGGDLNVGDAPAGIDLKTMGGDITAGAVSDHAKVETMGGDITLGPVAGWLEGTTMGGDITASVVGTDGDRHVELSSMGGDIELTVPAGLSASFDVEVKIQGRRARSEDYGIRSDFDLTESTRGSGSDRTLVATGSIAGGRNKIKVTTTNGHITIRRGN